MRASWVFTRSDVIANFGVIIAAALVALTNTRWPDLIVGAAITGVVIKGGFSILSDARKEGSDKAPAPVPPETRL
jgi:Co/Zn/Cd efflux system component